MSGRAEALARIDAALADVSAIQTLLTAAGRGQRPAVDWADLAARFHTLAHAGAGHHAFAPVRELAALAEQVTEGDIELLQHAADVLSLLLRDMGHQLLGRRGADLAPAANALRDRLEHALVAVSR